MPNTISNPFPVRDVTPAQPLRLRVLVCDDNRDARDTLQMYLGLLGHQVLCASDGAEALLVAANFRPIVVLLDLGMPRMNGLDAARALRRMEARSNPAAPRTMLIATTGWGQPEDRERSRQAGFDHHLVKPLDPQALAQLLSGAGPARPWSSAALSDGLHVADIDRRG